MTSRETGDGTVKSLTQFKLELRDKVAEEQSLIARGEESGKLCATQWLSLTELYLEAYPYYPGAGARWERLSLVHPLAVCIDERRPKIDKILQYHGIAYNEIDLRQYASRLLGDEAFVSIEVDTGQKMPRSLWRIAVIDVYESMKEYCDGVVISMIDWLSDRCLYPIPIYSMGQATWRRVEALTLELARLAFESLQKDLIAVQPGRMHPASTRDEPVHTIALDVYEDCEAPFGALLSQLALRQLPEGDPQFQYRIRIGEKPWLTT